ncbi:hypothetical protein [Streptomyces sp. NPDC059063]|uniref:hypothetical protein n=1 Tax=Streptomyces sp. NPDC059063 TaxID=3346712 RepID=UPI00369F70B9
MGNPKESGVSSFEWEKRRRQEERDQLKAEHAECAVCIEVGNTWETDQYAGHRPAPWTERGNVCTGCKEYKPWIEYRPDQRALMGRRKRCRTCEDRRSHGSEPRAGAVGPTPQRNRR